MYSYHEGEEKERAASPLLDTPLSGGWGIYYEISRRCYEGGGWEKRRLIDLRHWLLYTGRQGGYGMEQTFEATIEKRDKWYIGWVDAVPGAFSQGRTIEEVAENLKEAVQLILESQQELKDKGTGGGIVKRKIQVQV